MAPTSYAAITTSIGTPNSTGQRCAYPAPATMVKASSFRASLFPFGPDSALAEETALIGQVVGSVA